MRDSERFSRRDMLKLTGALGAFAMTGGPSSVLAQGTQKIESSAPEFANIIAATEQIRELATGYGGDIGPAEGPVWISEGHYLLFNDINSARRLKYTPGQGAGVVMEKTNEAAPSRVKIQWLPLIRSAKPCCTSIVRRSFGSATQHTNQYRIGHFALRVAQTRCVHQGRCARRRGLYEPLGSAPSTSPGMSGGL